jgi:hypothetical protein
MSSSWSKHFQNAFADFAYVIDLDVHLLLIQFLMQVQIKFPTQIPKVRELVNTVIKMCKDCE